MEPDLFQPIKLNIMLSEFVLLVNRMRKAQQEYFAYGTNSNLKIAKSLEYQVDRELRKMIEVKPSAIKTLFDTLL